MDISLRIETKIIPFSARHALLLQRFRSNRLFPLIRIVRMSENEGEIINVYMATVDISEDNKHYLIARQIEIIRKQKPAKESAKELQIPFSMN